MLINYFQQHFNYFPSNCFVGVNFVPGEFIYQFAEVTTKIYLIEKGTAKVYSPIDMLGMGMTKDDIDKKLGEIR